MERVIKYLSLVLVLVFMAGCAGVDYQKEREKTERKWREEARYEFTHNKTVGLNEDRICRINNMTELMKRGNGNGIVWIGTVRASLEKPEAPHMRGYLDGKQVDVTCVGCREILTWGVYTIKNWEITDKMCSRQCAYDYIYIDEGLKVLKQKLGGNK